MQTKQKVVLGCTLAVTLVTPLISAHAFSITADDVSPVAQAVAGGPSGSLGGFNASPFLFTASRSVALGITGTPTDLAVSSASTKGRQTFGGSSNGGSVRQCQTTSISAPTPIAAPDSTKDGCV